MQTYGAGELPIVNRTGGTIPAGSIARIVCRDGTDPDYWEVGQPDAADMLDICCVPDALADDRKGTGLLFTHPRVISHSLGSPFPTCMLGSAAGAWTAGRGTTLRSLAVDGGQAEVIFVRQALIGRAALFQVQFTGQQDTWVECRMEIPGRATTSGGVRIRWPGQVLGMHVDYSDSGSPTGTLSFRAKNLDTGDTDGAPEVSGIMGSGDDADGTGPGFEKNENLIVEAKPTDNDTYDGLAVVQFDLVLGPF